MCIYTHMYTYIYSYIAIYIWIVYPNKAPLGPLWAPLALARQALAGRALVGQALVRPRGPL